jgi:hypothetical protein
MSKIVEVAKAIYGPAYGADGSDILTDQHMAARRAIKAMRKPTEHMIEIGMKHTGDPCWADDLEAAFGFMIDEALK